jgi:TPR repeat protein
MRALLVALACCCLSLSNALAQNATPILGNAPLPTVRMATPAPANGAEPLPGQPQSAPPVAGNQQMFGWGTTYYDRRDYVHAYQVFYWLAEQDDVAAMRNVALMKRRGQGTPRDPKGALEYLKEAADAGLPTAQADLAEMYLFGEAGVPDPQSALPWLEAAAKVHHPIAAFRLAEIYERGAIVRRDVAKAESLYAEAASRGIPQAATRLALLKSGAVSAPRP